MIIRHRLTRNFNLTTFTDELHSDVGASAFVLSELSDNDIETTQGHDYFTGEDLVIRTASGGGGTLLVENTDYVLAQQNSYLTNKAVEYAGVQKTVYKKIQITNAAYQSGNLYFSGKYIADDLNSEDHNSITNYCKAISTDTIISDSVGYITYLVTTTDTVKTTVTLPDATKNANLILKIMKSSDTYAPVVVDTYSTQTINGWSYTIDGTTYQLVPIFFQNEVMELISDGSNWKIINGYRPQFDSGLIYNTDFTNLDVAQRRVNLSSGASNFELYEVVTDENDKRGIISNINTGSNYLDVLQVIPSNITTGATDTFSGTTLTGNSSSASETISSESINTGMQYYFTPNNGYALVSGSNLGNDLELFAEVSYTWADIKDYSLKVFTDVGSGATYAIMAVVGRTDNNISTGYILMGGGGVDIINLTTRVTARASSGWFRLVMKAKR